MYRLCEPNRLKDNCVACEYEELQRIQTCPAVLELKDKLEKLSTRLKECHSENHALKRNLDLARHLVQKEAEEETKEFCKFPEIGREIGWKGKMNTVLQLSKQIWKLEEKLRDLEEEKPPAIPPDDYSQKNLRSERKAFWRMELERRQARIGAVQEISPVTKECSELRKKLDAEKTRFRNLKQEVHKLRNELQNKKDKNDEEKGLVKAYHLLKDQLYSTSLEVCQIRDAYMGARSRNADLNREVEALRKEIKTIQDNTKDNNKRIEGITENKRLIQEGIDSVRSVVKHNIIRYAEDLKQVEDSSKDLEIVYEMIQNLTSEKIHLVREFESLLENIMELSREEDDLSSSLSQLDEEGEVSNEPLSNADNDDKNDDNADSKQVVIKEEVGEQENVSPQENVVIKKEVVQPQEVVRDYNSLQIEKLMLECAKYKSLIEATKTESDRYTYLTTIQEDRLKEIARQLVETRRLLTQKNSERKLLMQKIPYNQNPLLKRKQNIQNVNKDTNTKLRINIQARKEENEFLRNLLKTIVESKIQDTYLYKSFVVDSKNFFEIAFKKMKDVSRVLRSKRNESLRKPNILMNL